MAIHHGDAPLAALCGAARNLYHAFLKINVSPFHIENLAKSQSAIQSDNHGRFQSRQFACQGFKNARFFFMANNTLFAIVHLEGVNP